MHRMIADFDYFEYDYFVCLSN